MNRRFQIATLKHSSPFSTVEIQIRLNDTTILHVPLFFRVHCCVFKSGQQLKITIPGCTLVFDIKDDGNK